MCVCFLMWNFCACIKLCGIRIMCPFPFAHDMFWKHGVHYRWIKSKIYGCIMHYPKTFIRSCTCSSSLMRPLNPSRDIGKKRWLIILNDRSLTIMDSIYLDLLLWIWYASSFLIIFLIPHYHTYPKENHFMSYSNHVQTIVF